MLALLGLLVGLAGGAAGTAAWLLSEPIGNPTPTAMPGPAGRLQDVRNRFDQAVMEGKRAGAETENRLRQQLDATRRHPNRSGISH